MAMSFHEQYEQRFSDIIAPAIRALEINGVSLQPTRVDLSKTGDSILTDIMDGIAHCHLFLADLSTVGKDEVSGLIFRNGNVMYEVGLALACRQPSEVLLIRDDQDKFLFDVSTIPHKHIDFSEEAKAKKEINTALIERLKEQDFRFDARVQKAISSLSFQEHAILSGLGSYDAFTYEEATTVNFAHMEAIPRLLDKQIITMVKKFIPVNKEKQTKPIAYKLTPLGYEVVQLVVSDKSSVSKVSIKSTL